MMYHVIYDGNCNLCVNFVKLLEQFDQGQQFRYTPMQDSAALEPFGITPQDCELGVILINPDNPNQRWQGSAADRQGIHRGVSWLTRREMVG
jgi:predicted DCC family thiol-disulfide oxidoreductase YuxK